MLYYLYEMNHAAVAPWRAAAGCRPSFWQIAANPLSATRWAAHCRLARSVRARHPALWQAGLRHHRHDLGDDARRRQRDAWCLKKPFCNLAAISQGDGRDGKTKREHKLLIVAPMSGHYATLLRGTVEAMLPHYDVYITDWIDARAVPLSQGTFDLDDYIDYVIEMLQLLGPRHQRHGRLPAFGAGAWRRCR